MTTFLQLFLLINIFVMGFLAETAVRHAYAHFRPAKHEPPERPHQPPTHEIRLSAEAKERLQQTAEANFKAVLDHSATKLHHELDQASGKINNLVEHMGTEIVSNELERYRLELVELRKQTQAKLDAVHAEVAKHEDELKAKLAQEIETEKLRLIKQIDTKLADAVASFLIETLQHNVDLGGQSAYLTAMLEEHKADFAKEVAE